MKVRFLAGAADVELDAVLASGRDVEIRATVGYRSMCFEATVITESDEDQNVWTRFMATKADDEHAVLVRPGEHDNVNAKWPSLYYDTVRLYAKIYDKLAKNGDPAKPLLSDNRPNVILLSVWTGHGMPYSSSPGIGWALDEPFADQPNAGASFRSPGPDLQLRQRLGPPPQRSAALRAPNQSPSPPRTRLAP